ncbi:hypothetical protein C1I60_19955 [Paenibacillus terrae]|uniref:Uncharacterized protein n=1 Tax=Paenibacillus terrae TaxID=159743 RepID=A0A4U2PQY8_9BACL|nr:hypothetical protein C1I60_19955 [Paenibacillus terrae]
MFVGTKCMIRKYICFTVKADLGYYPILATMNRKMTMKEINLNFWGILHTYWFQEYPIPFMYVLQQTTKPGGNRNV